jgi:toxin CptA
LGACISLSLAHSLLRHGFLRTGAALLAIELREYDSASVETPDGQWQEARVLPTTYVSALLTVINVRVPPGVFARHMVIAPDSTDPESFRRLRVWLRWKYRQAE